MGESEPESNHCEIQKQKSDTESNHSGIQKGESDQNLPFMKNESCSPLEGGNFLEFCLRLKCVILNHFIAALLKYSRLEEYTCCMCDSISGLFYSYFLAAGRVECMWRSGSILGSHYMCMMSLPYSLVCIISVVKSST